MKKFLTLILVMSLACSNVYAGEGSDGVGNGDDNPELALNPEQEAVLARGYSLDYLKLSPKEIKERERKLAPLSDYYKTAVAKAVNAISTLYGINVYHHTGREISFNNQKEIKKPLIMAAATRFYLNGSDHQDQWHREREGVKYQSPLRDAPESEIGYRNLIEIEDGKVMMTKVNGSRKHFNETTEIETPYAIASQVTTQYDDTFFGFIDTERQATFSSTNNKLFTMPGLVNFLDAIKASKLKGLDATLVFTNGDVTAGKISREICKDVSYNSAFETRTNQLDSNRYDDVTILEPARKLAARYKHLTIDANDNVNAESVKIDNMNFTDIIYNPYHAMWFFTVSYNACKTEEVPNTAKYQVVYPTFSRLAPVPQPVIYLNVNSSKDEVGKMLADHAPRIYAYNQLFDEQVLPQVQDLNSILEKYPNFLEDVRKMAKGVSKHNVQRALQEAFLTVSYGIGFAVAAPLTLAAMLASPLYYPILVKTTVIILL